MEKFMTREQRAELDRKDQRREIATRLLAGMLAQPDMTLDINKGALGQARCETAVALADTLLAVLEETP